RAPRQGPEPLRPRPACRGQTAIQPANPVRAARTSASREPDGTDPQSHAAVCSGRCRGQPGRAQQPGRPGLGPAGPGPPAPGRGGGPGGGGPAEPAAGLAGPDADGSSLPGPAASWPGAEADQAGGRHASLFEPRSASQEAADQRGADGSGRATSEAPQTGTAG